MTREEIEKIAQESDNYEFVTYGQLSDAVGLAIEISNAQLDLAMKNILTDDRTAFNARCIVVIEQLKIKL